MFVGLFENKFSSLFKEIIIEYVFKKSIRPSESFKKTWSYLKNGLYQINRSDTDFALKKIKKMCLK